MTSGGVHSTLFVGSALHSALRRFHFLEAVEAAGIDWGKLRRQIRLCKQLFPDWYEGLTNLVLQLEGLGTEASFAFHRAVAATPPAEWRVVCCFAESPNESSDGCFLARTANLRNARVVSPSQLCGRHLCKTLAAIGPCGWFPEHVFSAPRAAAIHVISPRWIRDSWKPGPIFLHNSDKSGSRNLNHRIGAMPRVGGETRPENHTSTDLLPIDLLPPMPTFDGNGRPFAGQSGGGEETVPARLCHLSGQRVVFVAADDGSSSLIIDTSEMGNTTVRRVPVGELEPGHYLLLRTSGGGDFIAPLADRIMGDLAEKRRSEQLEWKQRLISAATERFGQVGRWDLAARVSAKLQSQALSRVRPANVHYWMSSKCIRPRKIEDFVAILTFAGLRERSQKLWSAMGDIDRAHRQAGHAIRRMLLHKIAATSLEPLERDGEMVFELGGEDGGTLSAFEITAIAAEDYEVPADQIGVLLEMED